VLNLDFMLKKALIPLFLFLSVNGILAQNSMDSRQYDWNPGIKGFGLVRGLEVSYHSNSSFDLTSTSDFYGDSKAKISHNRIFKTKLKFPIFLKSKVKITGGFEYSDEEFHFDDNEYTPYPLYKSLNDKNLKSIGGSLYMIAQLRRNMFFMLRFNAKLKGDYWKEHIGNVSKYTFLKMEISPIVGWKVNENKSWGLGVAYSYTFGDPLIFPLVLYNHKFAEKWGIEALFPARIKLRYQASELCYINAKARLQGGSYSIHFDDPLLGDFKTLELRRSDVNFSMELEKGITDWLWLSLEGGYRTNINFDVTNKNHPFSLSGSKLTSENNTIDSYASGGLFFNLSLFIVPSKKLLEKVGLR